MPDANGPGLAFVKKERWQKKDQGVEFYNSTFPLLTLRLSRRNYLKAALRINSSSQQNISY